MSKSLLILRRISVENANAISGLTYGFPAMTNFLGFAHALSRKLLPLFDIELNGCGVICHNHHIKAHKPKPYADYVFSLTRNPLTKEGKTASFNEEGKMHMEVSLLIEVNGYFPSSKKQQVKTYLEGKLQSMRLAGGDIVDVESIEPLEYPEDEKKHRQLLFSMLPGFALTDKSDALRQHCYSLQKDNKTADMLDALLDFSALKYRAEPSKNKSEQDDSEAVESPDEISLDTKAKWEYLPKPEAGYLVPIMVGYKSISPLYEPGEVINARDQETPFRFVEAAYGLGQWQSPHRFNEIDKLFWHYQIKDDYYLCQQSN